MCIASSGKSIVVDQVKGSKHEIIDVFLKSDSGILGVSSPYLTSTLRTW